MEHQSTNPTGTLTHSHSAHCKTHIFRKNDYVATYFEAGHSAQPQSSFISINLCFWCVCYYYCCLSQYSQCQSTHCEWVDDFYVCLLRWLVGMRERVPDTGINMKIYNNLRVHSPYNFFKWNARAKKNHCNECNVHNIHLNVSPHFILVTVFFIIRPMFMWTLNEWIEQWRVQDNKKSKQNKTKPNWESRISKAEKLPSNIIIVLFSGLKFYLEMCFFSSVRFQ